MKPSQATVTVAATATRTRAASETGKKLGRSQKSSSLHDACRERERDAAATNRRNSRWV
jgi:hypothetical protein